MADTPFDELVKKAYFAGVADAQSMPDAPAEEIEIHYQAWRDDLGGRTWTQTDWHHAYNGPDSELPGMWSTSDLVGGESDAARTPWVCQAPGCTLHGGHPGDHHPWHVLQSNYNRGASNG